MTSAVTPVAVYCRAPLAGGGGEPAGGGGHAPGGGGAMVACGPLGAPQVMVIVQRSRS